MSTTWPEDELRRLRKPMTCIFRHSARIGELPKIFVHFLYQKPAFEAFDVSDFLKSTSCETSKTCQVRGSNPCRGATLIFHHLAAFVYLKDSLGTSTDVLTLFACALSSLTDEHVSKARYLSLRSLPAKGREPIQVRIPVRDLAKELNDGSRVPGLATRKKAIRLEARVHAYLGIGGKGFVRCNGIPNCGRNSRLPSWEKDVAGDHDWVVEQNSLEM
jgi:hypothetical protein